MAQSRSSIPPPPNKAADAAPEVTTSIALATYNGAAYLAAQLESYLQQSLHPSEVVISDDGSSDATLSLVEEFSSRAPFPVRVLHNRERLGYAQNFSRALSHCTGDVVFLSDQDDVWHHDKISRVVLFLRDNPRAQLVIHDLAICTGDLTPTGVTKLQRNAASSEPIFGYTVGMATAVRRPFLTSCLPVPRKQGVAHDSWLHICAATVGVKAIQPEILASFRRHSNATSLQFTVLNSVEAPSAIDLARHKLASSTITNLLRHRNQHAALADWLQSHHTRIVNDFSVSEAVFQRALITTRKRIAAIEARVALCSLPRWKRPGPAFALYTNGGYQNFSGWKSLLKDLVIGAAPRAGETDA